MYIYYMRADDKLDIKVSARNAKIQYLVLF